MEKRFNAMINEAIRCLDWTIILDYYSVHDYLEVGMSSRKRKSLAKTHKGVTKEFLIKELKSILAFVIENDVREFDHDKWYVLFRRDENLRSDGLGAKLEVMFLPTRGVAYEGEFKPEEEDTDNTKLERNMMLDLLDKSLKEENYELSAVLRDKIKKIDKLIKYTR
jgi:hypothetical protein